MARILTGKVTSDKGDKTIVITVSERKTHPIYKKQYTVNTKFMAHDEKNDAKVGDLVQIIETRPLSARKRFALNKILERGGVRFEETDATADVEEVAAQPEAEAEPEKPVKKTTPRKKASAPKEAK